jgi:hypothetical protein
MNERKYRRLFEQFLNDYWGAFHEVLEAQSVNPRMVAGSLFDALLHAHTRFAVVADGLGPELERLERLWSQIADRRAETPGAPLTAREVAHARVQFEALYDGFVARGTLYPLASRKAHAAAVHGTPRMPLRADAAV